MADAALKYTPAILGHLAAADGGPGSPRARASFTRWVRLLGEFGNIGHALWREENGGFTLTGHGVVDLLDDLAVREAEMDSSDLGEREW